MIFKKIKWGNMKKNLLIIGLLITQFLSATEEAGTLYLNNINREDVSINSIQIKYKMFTFIKEPCKSFIMKYIPSDDFTTITSLELRARVLCGTRQNAYIAIDPMIAKPNTWGIEVPGSPNWENLFLTENNGSVSKEKAKDYFKQGFSLVDLEIIKLTASKGKPEGDQYSNKFFKTKKNNITELEKSLPVVHARGLRGVGPKYMSQKQKNNDWTKFNAFSTDWDNITSSSSITPNDSQYLFSIKKKEWSCNGKAYNVYQVVYEKGPYDSKKGKNLDDKCELSIVCDWRTGGNFMGEQIGGEMKSSFSIVPKDKIVFMTTCEMGNGSYIKLIHTPPKTEDDKKEKVVDPFADNATANPFDQDADKKDPFAQNADEKNPFAQKSGPENPFDKSDRIEQERLEEIRIANEKARIERERLAKIEAEKINVMVILLLMDNILTKHFLIQKYHFIYMEEIRQVRIAEHVNTEIHILNINIFQFLQNL